MEQSHPQPLFSRFICFNSGHRFPPTEHMLRVFGAGRGRRTTSRWIPWRHAEAKATKSCPNLTMRSLGLVYIHSKARRGITQCKYAFGAGDEISRRHPLLECGSRSRREVQHQRGPAVGVRAMLSVLGWISPGLGRSRGRSRRISRIHGGALAHLGRSDEACSQPVALAFSGVRALRATWIGDADST